MSGVCRRLARLSAGLLLAAPAFAVRVDVTAPDGKPAAGAEVRAFIGRATRSLIEIRRGYLASGTTDAAGRVDLALPAVSRLVLAVDAPGLAPRVVPVEMLAGAPLRIALDAGAILRGTARSEGPASGRACVTWQQTLESLGQTLDFERCGSLGTEGAFSISGLDARAQGLLTVTADGYLPLRAPWPTESRSFRLSRGTTLQGIVLGPGERPVPGARLTVDGAGEVVSDSGGRFETQAAKLPARLAVQAPGFHRRDVDVRQPEPLRIRLAPGATLQARVLDASGKPVDKVALLLRRQTRPRLLDAGRDRRRDPPGRSPPGPCQTRPLPVRGAGSGAAAVRLRALRGRRDPGSQPGSRHPLRGWRRRGVGNQRPHWASARGSFW